MCFVELKTFFQPAETFSSRGAFDFIKTDKQPKLSNMNWWQQLVLLLVSMGLAYYWSPHLALLLVGVGLICWWLSGDKLHTLKGKRVLVTGSSAGIGEQIAYIYARHGASVVVTARTVEKLNKVLKECQTLSPSPDTKHFSVPADMSKLDDTKRLIEEATKLLGGLDVLVLNHVKPPRKALFEGKVEDLQDIDDDLHINFKAYVHLTAHALPQLLGNKGSIIVVNSVAGIISPIYYSTQCSSKFALNGFFNSLRSQFVSRGQDVSVTSCFLGKIGTERVLSDNKKPNTSTLHDIFVASPEDTALDIVKGGARRQREVFSPYFFGRPAPLLYSLVPDLLDATFRQLIRLLDD